jgi:hypothetical protein
MHDRHAPIRWERSTAARLPEPLRRQVGEMWADRMRGEHRSIGIFNLYALDLLGAGAAAPVVSHACRAALDEVRHTELCQRMASLYLDTTPTPPPGIPPMPDDPGVSLLHQVAREALHLCVMSETFSAVNLSHHRERARDPVARQVLGVILADEVHHARMGWAFLADILDTGDLRPWLQAEAREMFDGYVRDIFGDPREIAPPDLVDVDLARDHGYASARESFALFADTMRDIWVPGLARLRLDVSGLDTTLLALATPYRDNDRPTG